MGTQLHDHCGIVSMPIVGVLCVWTEREESEMTEVLSLTESMVALLAKI